MENLYQEIYALCEAQPEIKRGLSRTLRAWNITLKDYIVMKILIEKRAKVLVSELKQISGIKTTPLSKIISKLWDMGCALSQRTMDDRRQGTYLITQAGIDHFNSAMSDVGLWIKQAPNLETEIRKMLEMALLPPP